MNYIADNALNDVCWDCGFKKGLFMGQCHEDFCPLHEERAKLKDECDALFTKINELAEKARAINF